MADIFTKAKRSEVMSLIRSRGNKDTEVVLAKLLSPPLDHRLASPLKHQTSN